MTTTTTDNDAKKLGGYLKEKLTIAWTRFSDDELVRAITKVSSHMLKIPNEKHLQRLLNATYGQFNSGGNDYGEVNKFIVESLEAHLHAHNWVVVLKTGLAFHRLMQDGSDAFNVRLQDRRGLFSLSHIKDLADSPEGAEQQVFITHYLRYLEERSIAQSANHNRLKGMRIENQAFANQLLTLSGREAVACTSGLLLQFETAIDVQFLAHAVNNFATLQGHKSILNDAKLLFVAISRKMVGILERVDMFSPEEREQWLPVYKRYAISSRKFAAKLTEMQQSRVAWGEQLPTIRALPDDILEQLGMVLDPKHKAGAALGASSGGGGGFNSAGIERGYSSAAAVSQQQQQSLEPGELPRVRLSDVLAQQQNAASYAQQQNQRLSPVEGNNNNNNGVFQGQVAPQSEPAGYQQKQTLSDIFSPVKTPGQQPSISGAPMPGTANSGSAVPDLFSQPPSRPQPQPGTSNNNAMLDLFGGGNNNNNRPAQLAPAPAQPTSNNNSNAMDIFGQPAPRAAAPVTATGPATSTARVPLDPFATIGAAPAGGQTAPPVNNNNTNAMFGGGSQQPIFGDGNSNPISNNNGGSNAGPNVMDFFAAPSSAPANRAPAQQGPGANNNAPAFDPFAPADPSGRQRAW